MFLFLWLQCSCFFGYNVPVSLATMFMFLWLQCSFGYHVPLPLTTMFLFLWLQCSCSFGYNVPVPWLQRSCSFGYNVPVILVPDSQTQLEPRSEADQASPPSSSSSPPHKPSSSSTAVSSDPDPKDKGHSKGHSNKGHVKGHDGEVKVNSKPETVDRGVGSTPLPPTISEHRGPPYLGTFPPPPFGFSDPRNGLDTFGGESLNVCSFHFILLFYGGC